MEYNQIKSTLQEAQWYHSIEEPGYLILQLDDVKIGLMQGSFDRKNMTVSGCLNMGPTRFYATGQDKAKEIALKKLRYLIKSIMDINPQNCIWNAITSYRVKTDIGPFHVQVNSLYCDKLCVYTGNGSSAQVFEPDVSPDISQKPIKERAQIFFKQYLESLKAQLARVEEQIKHLK